MKFILVILGVALRYQVCPYAPHCIEESQRKYQACFFLLCFHDFMIVQLGEYDWPFFSFKD